MRTYKVFAQKVDGTLISWGHGTGDAPIIGDEIRADDHTVVVYRRVFDIATGEYHLYVKRSE